MIGHIQGEVLFSDGQEVIVLTNSGIGYQINLTKILAEGHYVSLYISHVIKEAAQTLFGFETLREKKLFELLLSVKGVGPKGAFSIVSSLPVKEIIQAIIFEDKKILSKAPGIGAKAAAQMILDLSSKIKKIQMYSDTYKVSSLKQVGLKEILIDEFNQKQDELSVNDEQENEYYMLNEAVMACKELGFKEDKINLLAQKIMSEHVVTKSEQLVHLVLKEI